MATIEQKYEAALVLLEAMTDILTESLNYDMEAVVKSATEHRRRFDAETNTRPEINAAGKEVAAEIADRAERSLVDILEGEDNAAKQGYPNA